MNPTDSRLPSALEAAVGHVKATAAQVAERVASSLGTQAQTALRMAPRETPEELARVFTEAVRATHVIRKVLLRQLAILNYVNPF